jgi:hypothetical protein
MRSVLMWLLLLASLPGADWRTATNGDANSITDNPALNADYTMTVGSPAKWSGTATGQLSVADKIGTSWHSPPSMGAYEYVSGVGDIIGIIWAK